MTKKVIITAWLVLAITVCACFLGRQMSSPETGMNAYIIRSIDEKIDTVMDLTAASTVASVAISAIPDDTATPLADKLADFSGYFLIVLCMLYLEKYLVTLIGFSAFTFLIPAGLGLIVIYLYSKKTAFKTWGIRILAGSLLLFAMVPMSVKASDLVYATCRSSLAQTAADGQTFSLELESGSEEEQAEKGGAISHVITKVTSISKNVIEKAKSLITGFMEALAIMIVTSCLIPVIVLLLFLKGIKRVMGLETLPFTIKKV